MIGATERLLEMRSAVPADRQKSIGEAEVWQLRSSGWARHASRLCDGLCRSRRRGGWQTLEASH